MKPIKHIEPTNDLNELTERMRDTGFGASNLAKAVDILEDSIRRKSKIFLGVSGAIVPAGMRKLLKEMIDDGWISVVVSTGANITHDMIEAQGEHHYCGSRYADDAELRDKGIDRIYDVFLPNKGYEELEKWLHEIFDRLYEEHGNKPVSIRQFVSEISERIDDNESWIKSCRNRNVPLFCPAIQDCAIGFQYWSWMMKTGRSLNVDTFSDMKELMDICWTSEDTTVFILGGGVPKDFILQAMQFSPKEHSSAVQITMDVPETGGLSGAELKEAISWGKLGKNAKHCTVNADITIVLPIIVSALKERLKS